MCESILRNSSLDNNETILRNSHHLSVELPSPPNPTPSYSGR